MNLVLDFQMGFPKRQTITNFWWLNMEFLLVLPRTAGIIIMVTESMPSLVGTEEDLDW